MIKSTFLIGLTLILILSGCSNEDATSKSSAKLEVVTSSSTNFTLENFFSLGFKKYRIYDVTELQGATDAVFGFWGTGAYERKEYEIRIYGSHEDAVSLGEPLAKEATGNDAVIKSSKSSWKEGLKDRRTIGGPGSGGGGRSGSFPKYGNYAIYGNVVMLCEGAEEIALEICWRLINKLN